MSLVGKTLAHWFSPSSTHGSENVEFPTQEVLVAVSKYVREMIEEHMETNPYQVLAMAFGVGYVIGGGYFGKRHSLFWSLGGKRVTKWLVRRAAFLVAQQLMIKLVASKKMQRSHTEE